MFIGIEGIARKVTGAHIGVDGVARRAKKLYMGVDGKARLCWEAGGRVRAYLYNGVKLPELLPAPEGYHHACIVKGTWSGLYTLTFLPSLTFANISDKWSVDLSCGYVRATYQVGHPSYDGWSSLREETSSGFRIVVGNILWANFDVLNEDGSTLLEASDPVPLYSYNGVELPELPEWDIEIYPYAYIERTDNPTYGTVMYYSLNLYSNEVYVTEKGVVCHRFDSVTKTFATYDPDKRTNWGGLEEPVVNTNGVLWAGHKNIIWANFDLLYKDGTKRLPENEPQPQPVYM